jgi:hypothetical protein
LLALLLAALPAGAAVSKPKPPHQTEAEGAAQLERFAQTFHTPAEWRQRAAQNRQGILAGANLVPLPTRTPLNPIIRGPSRRSKGGRRSTRRCCRPKPRPPSTNDAHRADSRMVERD